jgi:hypothetical protein
MGSRPVSLLDLCWAGTRRLGMASLRLWAGPTRGRTRSAGDLLDPLAITSHLPWSDPGPREKPAPRRADGDRRTVGAAQPPEHAALPLGLGADSQEPDQSHPRARLRLHTMALCCC